MQQDIRDALKNFKEEDIVLTKNHSKKFEDLLMQQMHPKNSKKKRYTWLSIAASIVLLLSVAIQFYPETKIDNPVKEISLGSISPEFNSIETYYTNSINLVMSDLEVTDANEEILFGYLSKIKELSIEYKSLTKELNTKGVNDNTIDALIRNLQLRLQLLQRLKKQLKQLKNLNTHKNENTII
jgi:hypothetical protein